MGDTALLFDNECKDNLNITWLTKLDIIGGIVVEFKDDQMFDHQGHVL